MLQTRNEIESGTSGGARDRLSAVINMAKKAGADAAEAVFAVSHSLSVGVRKGEVETVERDETSDLGLRVFVGRRQAVVSISEFSRSTLERTVERAIAMAKLAPEDPYAWLADPALLYRPIRQANTDLQMFDRTLFSAEGLQTRALDIEAAGIGLSPALQSDAASAGYSNYQWHMQTSDGFEGAHKSSLFYQSGRFIATDADGNMERDGEGRSTRFAEDLPDVALTGRIAAERALAAMGARKVGTQKMAVLFDKRIAKSLIGQFLGAISGTMIARGSSFLKHKLGERIFSDKVQIVDDPLRLRGLGSCLFDDEGVKVMRREIVKDGVLTTWLLNTAAGRQLGMASTGHASRSLAGPSGVSTHNVVLMPGADSPEALMRDAGKGIVVTSMFGPSVNSDTGDWSAGASGFWFENGEIQYPVNEITVAGNLIEMYARLVPASDLEIRGTVDAPGIMIDGLSVGGK